MDIAAPAGADVPFWIQVTAIALAPILGFAGVAIGAILKDRSDALNALRDRRHKAYTAYLKHVSDASSAFATESATKLRSGDAAKIREVFVDLQKATNALPALYAEIDLLGSYQTQAAVADGFRLVEMQTDVVIQALSGEVDATVISKVHEAGIRALMNFRNAAAKDLGVSRKDRKRYRPLLSVDGGAEPQQRKAMFGRQRTKAKVP
ncbi:hypothetical protein ABZU25_03275 [Micromonospora sp. NPDC005215]|uniref:hypothetical protein n=1 Tax=Micromonospora sp. NPDC005215 TaxID=3157024 RepID=UPI0033B27F66